MSHSDHWYIHTIYDVIGSPDVRTEVEGKWVQAVPSPYPGTLMNRIRAAWLVLTGKCVAFQWPKPGDFEYAIQKGGS